LIEAIKTYIQGPRLPLNSERFWQGCRVVESILCIDLEGSGYSYCSPVGLRREGWKLVIRVYEDGLLKKLLDAVNVGRLFICRDPMLIYTTLYNHIVSESDRKGWSSCGVVADIHVGLLRPGDGYSEYLVDVVSYERAEPSDPELVPRICRSENLLIEAMILETRRHLFARGPSELVEDFCAQYRYSMDNARRLSDRAEVLAAIARIASSGCP